MIYGRTFKHAFHGRKHKGKFSKEQLDGFRAAGWSWPRIGRHLGCDHTTAMHAAMRLGCDMSLVPAPTPIKAGRKPPAPRKPRPRKQEVCTRRSEWKPIGVWPSDIQFEDAKVRRA